MASIVLQMQSVGIEAESCVGCNKVIPRGDMMNAVKADNGDPLGWWCDSCIQEWRQRIKELESTK